MGNILRLLVVTFALLLGATGFGLWAATATTTDRTTAHHFAGGLDLPTRIPPLW
jgi:hypothetical protein